MLITSARIETWAPDAVGYSLNYLANIPEVIDLARETRRIVRTVSLLLAVTARPLPPTKSSITPTAQSIASSAAKAKKLRRCCSRQFVRTARRFIRYQELLRAMAKVRRQPRYKIWIISNLLTLWFRDAGNTLSASSIPALRSSSVGDVHGTVRSAAPGHFTGEAIASGRRNLLPMN